MKTLTDFKNKIQVGVKIHAYNHDYKIDYGVREVSIRKTCTFALKTKRDGVYVDSYCEFPKREDIEFSGNCATIFWKVDGIRKPILTYTFLD